MWWRHRVKTVLQKNGSRVQALVNIDIIIVCFDEKTSFMSNFMSSFLMECSYFHIKNVLKTFDNIVYALIYTQEVVIMCFYTLWNSASARHTCRHTNVDWAEEVWPELKHKRFLCPSLSHMWELSSHPLVWHANLVI